jgi:peptide/nickel transport system permease protein
MGLDRPFLVRLQDWFAHAIRGDLGQSLTLNQSVTATIIERYPITLSLTLFATVVAVAFGIPIGIIAAVRQGGFTDWFVMLLSLIVLSLPGFWLSLNMIFLFSIRLGWLPVGGYVSISKGVGSWLTHLILPGMGLGLGSAAMIARFTRTSMLEVLRQDYVTVARAKGLREQVVLFRHAFRNAMVPIVTVIGIQFGGLLGGAVITEVVFNMAGLGRTVVDAIARRDYPVVQGGVLVVTVTYLFVNLLTDLLYGLMDPRIRY